MDAVVNDFEVWQLDTPVVVIASDIDFEVWQLDAPVVGIDESNPAAVTRRRAQIF